MPESYTLFRIYCGLNGRPGTVTTKKTVATNRLIATRLADEFLEIYTLIESTGRWGGEKEPVLIFEIMADDPEFRWTVHSFANQYKLQADQESVAVAEQEASFTLI